MSQAVLLHAHLPRIYDFHSILYATSIFKVLPAHDLMTPDASMVSPEFLQWQTGWQSHTLVLKVPLPKIKPPKGASGAPSLASLQNRKVFYSTHLPSGPSCYLDMSLLMKTSRSLWLQHDNTTMSYIFISYTQCPLIYPSSLNLPAPFKIFLKWLKRWIITTNRIISINDILHISNLPPFLIPIVLNPPLALILLLSMTQIVTLLKMLIKVLYGAPNALINL
jgi:hypothetical protein